MSIKSQQRITVKVECEKELKEADKCCTSTAHHTSTQTHRVAKVTPSMGQTECVSFNCAQMNINIQKFNKIYFKKHKQQYLP